MKLPESHLLLVEDDPHLPEVLAELLRGDNIILTSARTGAEALQKSAERTFDLILLDLGLPDINGFRPASRDEAKTLGWKPCR